MKSNYIKYIWIAVTVLIYLATEFHIWKSGSWEASLGLIAAMTVLTLPVGLLSYLFLTLVFNLDLEFIRETLNTKSSLNLIFTWAIFFVAGYWQWFILLPKIIAKIKANREASRLSKSGN